LIGRTFRKAGIRGAFYGIDYASEMLGVCRERGDYSGVMQLDLSSGIPMAEQQCFDLVTAFGVSEFLPDIVSMCNQIAELLTPGGQLWMTFEMTDTKSSPSGDPVPEDGVIKFHYTREQIVSLIEQSGFHIVELEEDVGYHSPAYQRSIPYVFVRATRL
jgi:predicted TPR repeat methyltransferase